MPASRVLDDLLPRPGGPLPRVAVIGAGVSGLVLARMLTGAGFPVRVLDKGRGPGGRLSTRLHADGGTFDHGAQYFTARDPLFQAQVNAWREVGVAAEWRGRIGTLERGAVTPSSKESVRYVGVPGMNTLATVLAEGLGVRTGVRVERVARDGKAWRLTSDSGEDLGLADVVVAAVPAPQAVALLEGAPTLAARAREARLTPCWAVMARFAAPVALALDGAFVKDSPLSWAAREASKPGRASGERWVLHGSPEYSAAHLEETPEQVAPKLVEAFARAVGTDVRAVEAVAHRWRFAMPSPPLDTPALYDADTGLGACGDWCAGPRVEGAFLSGVALARQVVAGVAGG
ncbi:FAD-dependent oxidoreductase [Corallococcus sp. BB11-1]|uniref:NAD(P)/FAD-dependent oxidoreductase n=1 Tax=Corallococcus sp. BB11-1 TaxID=2996783 RepID=UPI0022720E30|nr:FAD-dependent oxidoreductase [Corallococcus sp. BB11-1]MCY1034115.1 FAD-dependent oxidoreductase [Corallococcus sp. BB11-1]